MIQRLDIKKVATFNDNGVVIDDLKKVNFFFGTNGTGKSTIARYLHNISLENQFQSQEFIYCNQVGYDDTKHQVLVFDDNFKDVNFIQNPLLKGVFSLAQKNDLIDKQIEAEELIIKGFQTQKKSKEILLEKVKSDQNRKKGDLIEHCWIQRTEFSLFNKISLVHSGNRNNHFQEIEKFIDRQSEKLSKEQIIKDYNLYFEKEINEIFKRLDTDSYQKLRRIELNLGILLNEVIVGNEDVDISSLINSLGIRSWVEAGYELLDSTGNICPFCQNETIDSEFRQKLSKYFDQNYKDKILQIRNLKNQFEEVAKFVLQNLIDIQGVYNPENAISNLYIEIQELFNRNIIIINEKLVKPNERKSIESISLFKKELSGIIQGINEINLAFRSVGSNKKKLIEDIWIYMASNCHSKIKDFQKQYVKAKRIENTICQLFTHFKTLCDESQEKIDLLRSQTINTKLAVENINLILKSSGFDGFEIIEMEKTSNISQYSLKRTNTTGNKHIYKSLSEGEKNFISFLYFHQLCLGTLDPQNSGSKEKVIVIDDPVSSLDNQSLFVVSTLIQDIICQKGKSNKPEKMSFKYTNISQVYIFTHNLYFYKEVSLNKRPICTDYWHYRLLKIKNETQIAGKYDKPAFDDYTLLWSSLKELKTNLPIDSSLNILIANTMRRIIESFVNFIGYSNESWGALIPLNQQEPSYYIKSSLISIINDGSHKVSVLDSVFYHKITNEQPGLLFDVFKDIFKSIGKEHYEMMLDEQIV